MCSSDLQALRGDFKARPGTRRGLEEQIDYRTSPQCRKFLYRTLVDFGETFRRLQNEFDIIMVEIFYFEKMLAR